MVKMKKIYIFILTLVLAFSLFGCGEKIDPSDMNKFYDKITRTLKLEKDYEGKSFLTDGIGKAKVDAYTDGDTVRFRLAQGNVLVVRFYEIDTPESTSTIEKWGKQASNFVKNRLSQATEIVLEATGPKAVHDSYGTRYLGYVWYKTADYDEFKNLNVELVENGFTDNKGVDTNDYPYYSYFREANMFARENTLHIYYDGEDPLYSTDPIEMTLKEFANNPDLYYNADTNSGAKVYIIGTLTSLRIADSGTYTYTLSEYDVEEHIVRTIDLYAGYVSSTASQMKIGRKYKFVGDLSQYYGHYQISNISIQVYQFYDPLPNESVLLLRKDYLIFNSSIDFIEQYSEALYGDLTITGVSYVDGEIHLTGTSYKITSKDDQGNVFAEESETFVIKVIAPESYVSSFHIGDTISTKGFVSSNNEITVVSYSDITKK